MQNENNILKLSQIQEQTGFTDKKHARNLADWLRKARIEPPMKLDKEIAYPRQFVVDVLTDLMPRIEKRYPQHIQSVNNFITPVITPVQTDWTHEQSRTFPPTPEPTPTTEAEKAGTNESNRTVSDAEPDGFRAFLTSSSVMLWGTAFVILIFLPFTVLNLKQYIAIEVESVAGDVLVWLLCALIGICWDFSILLFAVNGKKVMARIGALVLFIFMSAKFDFFKLIFNGIGFDGDTWQLGLVITAIVVYSPLLIYQFTELSKPQIDG